LHGLLSHPTQTRSYGYAARANRSSYGTDVDKKSNPHRASMHDITPPTEDYVCSSNQTKRDPLKLLFRHHKCHDSNGIKHDSKWPTSFCRLRAPYAREKKLKHEGNDYLQKTCNSWAKTNKLQAPCFKQVKGASGPTTTVHLWLPWKTQQIHGTIFFTNNEKIQNLPAEPKLDMCKLVFMKRHMPSTNMWPNNKQICHEMVIAPQ